MARRLTHGDGVGGGTLEVKAGEFEVEAISHTGIAHASISSFGWLDGVLDSNTVLTRVHQTMVGIGTTYTACIYLHSCVASPLPVLCLGHAGSTILYFHIEPDVVLFREGFFVLDRLTVDDMSTKRTPHRNRVCHLTVLNLKQLAPLHPP